MIDRNAMRLDRVALGGVRNVSASDEPERAAESAAASAGVLVREISDLSEIEAVVSLYTTLWGGAEVPPVTVQLLRAFAKAGNYIGGAFDGTELLGACVGFFAAPSEVSLHSHIAGVSAAARGRSVGFALKLHQRAWAMSRGVSEIAWTFDPLVSRNAHFNLVKLAADAVEYLPNFYGGMQDVINGADDSDRLLVRWRLNSPRVIAASAGSPRLGNAAYERSRGAVVALGVSATGAPAPGDIHGGISLVAIPTDIERMRLSDPHRAGEWRTAVRRALFALMAEGARVVGFDRDGWYILDSPGGAPLSPGPQSVATKGTES